MDECKCKILNHLLASEIHAWYVYFMAINLAGGKGSSEAVSEFKEHADDELKHAKDLMERMQQLNMPIAATLCDAANFTNGSDPLNPDLDSLIKLNIELEDQAIDDYTVALDVFKDDPVTALVLTEILKDEHEHKHDLDELTEDDNVIDFSKIAAYGKLRRHLMCKLGVSYDK